MSRITNKSIWINLITLTLLVIAGLCLLLDSSFPSMKLADRWALWFLVAGIVWSNIWMFISVMRRNIRFKRAACDKS